MLFASSPFSHTRETRHSEILRGLGYRREKSESVCLIKQSTQFAYSRIAYVGPGNVERQGDCRDCLWPGNGHHPAGAKLCRLRKERRASFRLETRPSIRFNRRLADAYSASHHQRRSLRSSSLRAFSALATMRTPCRVTASLSRTAARSTRTPPATWTTMSRPRNTR